MENKQKTIDENPQPTSSEKRCKWNNSDTYCGSLGRKDVHCNVDKDLCDFFEQLQK